MQTKFTPVDWSYATNIYEVNVRQYTPEGTFGAFSKELPRLKVMGVLTLWFMPITPISKDKRLGVLGSYYACSDYTDTNPEFGTVKDFTMLVKEAHQLGFKVIIDWVANHTGWDHKWTLSNPGYYKKDSSGHFYDSNNWEDVIDLNYYDQAMRKEMIKSMEFWVKECDIDGFRCDMAHLVPLDFWRQARNHLDGIKPLFWLAETEQVNYEQVFDCRYAWNWMHQSERFARGAISLEDLISSLLYYDKLTTSASVFLFYTSNHDENSWNGTEYEKYGDLALNLAVISCTWNGIPLIYSGQEMPIHKRLKFFDKDPIGWTGIYQLQEFYKTLLVLKAQNASLSAGGEGHETYILESSHKNEVLVFMRKFFKDEIIVVLNMSGTSCEVNFPDKRINGYFKNVFSGQVIDFSFRRMQLLEPWSYLIFEKIIS